MRTTVAVPTIAGRESYLASCLSTCVAQQDDDLEILVSDNSNDGAARAVVEDLGDSRIRYVQPPSYMPMAAHWDFVVSQAKGDVLTIIGDDDGLLPGCISQVRELLATFGEVPVAHALCNYFWPDYPEPTDRNTIVFFHPVHAGADLVEARDFLAGVAGARRRYVDGPMVYHYFVQTSTLRRLAVDGRIFRRSSPDVYSAVAVGNAVDRFAFNHQPLTISGQSALANGASVRLGGATGKRFMAENTADAYLRPRFRSRSIQLALLDSLLEVAETWERDDLLEGIDYPQHLRLALREIVGMDGATIQVKEAVELLGIAARSHSLRSFVATAANGLSLRIRDRTANWNRSNRGLVSNPDVPQTLVVPAGVSTVQGAAAVVQSYLASRYPVANRQSASD